MPRYSKETAKLKAENLVKSYTKSGFNQTRLAKKEGVTSQAINQRLKHLPVQGPLDKAFKRIGISTIYKARKFKELLEAKKLQDCDVFIKDENGKLKVNRNSNDFIEVEDNNARVATLRLLCQVQGDIKENSNGKGGNQVVIIRIGNPDKLFTPAQAELISPQRS